ncbi:MAG: class I SAM-dependent methyltransferase [Thermomicrobiales bacterium]
MSAQMNNDPVYAMGRSPEEMHRLERQGELVKRSTRLLFEDAGIRAGMKVLDVGSGSGDVALIAADLVGTTGRVVGVDMNPQIVETARFRAQAAGMTQISFITGDIREIELDQDFDAVVGRLVLVYQADPVATLRAALRAVRANGIAAFYECDMGSPMASLPESPLHQFVERCINETYARAGLETFMGTKLHQVFVAAGLDAPHLFYEAMMGGGREHVEAWAWWGANTLRSLMPLIVKYGVATAEEIGLETFEQRYRDEVLGQKSVIRSLACVGAWARKA